jgi:hypothetical protein
MTDFTIEQTVPEGVVRDLLICAWEGGSNYWAEADGPADLAFRPEGVVVRDCEGDEHLLNQKTLTNGLQVMARDWPRHWANVVNEDEMDAETGDVFLQCCLFGTIVYG